jgi:hypothetical protein
MVVTVVNLVCFGAERMRTVKSLSLFLIALGWTSRITVAADATSFDDLGVRFSKEIRPIVARHCEKCHSARLIFRHTLHWPRFVSILQPGSG